MVAHIGIMASRRHRTLIYLLRFLIGGSMVFVPATAGFVLWLAFGEPSTLDLVRRVSRR